MLKKRSRSKQALMADTNQKQSKPTPKTFPRLFTAFTSFKSFTENDAVASPTSILDTKPFSVLKNPFRLNLIISLSLLKLKNLFESVSNWKLSWQNSFYHVKSNCIPEKVVNSFWVQYLSLTSFWKMFLYTKNYIGYKVL